MNLPTSRPIEILLVEDSPGDVLLTREALREAKCRNRLHVVNDGEAALAFMRGVEPFADEPRPDVVLLDLNLPKKDGREVLTEMQADPTLRIMPVVVLTTSSQEADVLRSYQLGANAYVTKPVDFDRFLDVVRSIEEFWLEVVRLPT